VSKEDGKRPDCVILIPSKRERCYSRSQEDIIPVPARLCHSVDLQRAKATETSLTSDHRFGTIYLQIFAQFHLGL